MESFELLCLQPSEPIASESAGKNALMMAVLTDGRTDGQTDEDKNLFSCQFRATVGH